MLKKLSLYGNLLLCLALIVLLWMQEKQRRELSKLKSDRKIQDAKDKANVAIQESQESRRNLDAALKRFQDLRRQLNAK